MQRERNSHSYFSPLSFCLKGLETDTSPWNSSHSYGLGLQGINGEIQKSHLSPTNRNHRIILPWICWALCTARNLLIFEQKKLTVEEIAAKGLRLAKEWNNAQSSSNQIKKSLPDTSQQRSMRNSTEAIAICKTDAAWSKDTNKAGLGWIITGLPNQQIHKGAAPQDLVSTPLVAEALALRLGITAAVSLNLTKIRMLSDNQTLIRAINNDIQIKEIFGVVKDIQRIASVLVDISFSSISRDHNEEADRLAKRALSGSLSVNPTLG